MSETYLYQKLGYNTIFVALDGKESAKVLRRAAQLAAANDAKLAIGHVINQKHFEDKLPDEKSIEELIDTYRTSELAPLLEELHQEFKVDMSDVYVGFGYIREVLKSFIEDASPDLIICGTRAAALDQYAKSGAIETFLTRRTTADVLIVK